jgi:hypothetical protein
MSTLTRLALIAAGYALSVVIGLAAVAVNELFMPADIKETSGGMVAFGDMILLVFVTGFFSLVPTWFLLKLFVEKAPRTLLVTELAIAVMGPASWLAMVAMAVATPVGGPTSFPNLPQVLLVLLGLFLAFGAIPRIILGPILVVIEGLTYFLVPRGLGRRLLIAAMLMDVVPVSLYAVHWVRSVSYS